MLEIFNNDIYYNIKIDYNFKLFFKKIFGF